jgi:hypothetical protein
VATESKPQFVDFRSVVLVDMLGREVRRLADGDSDDAVSFSEMLPDVDGAWLADGQGNRYTSEIRMIAVDRDVRR